MKNLYTLTLSLLISTLGFAQWQYIGSAGFSNGVAGYQSFDVNSTSGNSTDIVVSRALGGGASVFAEMRTTNGTVTASSSTDGADDTSTMAIGTSVSF